MVSLIMQAPNSLRTFSVSASSNGSPSPTSRGNIGGPVILELPLDKIRRPLLRTRTNDQNKVEELMDSISQIGLQVPASRVVIAMKLISVLVSLQFAAKFVAEQKKLLGITFDNNSLQTASS